MPRKTRLREAALPFMQDLYEATHETIHLGVRDDLDVLSTSSPLGKAVLENATPGKVFGYTTPAKKTVQVELVSVRPAD